MILYFYSYYEYKITEIQTFKKNIYTTWPHETLPGFNFIQPGEEEQLPSTSIHPSLRTVFSSNHPTSLTLLLGPKSNRRLDIILGSTPTTSCAKHLVFFLRSGPFGSRKKGALESWKLFLLGMFWDGRCVVTRFPFLGVQSCGFQRTSGVDS